jgi:hypothetical protein
MQEELDALANKSSPRSLTTMPTTTMQHTPKTSAEPDMPLPDAPAAALVATEEWRITMGKATRGKAKAAMGKKKQTATPCDETPNKMNGGWGKKAHQLTTNHHHDARTWADVVRSGAINIQIVLGNGNLGTTQPETRKRERRDGARDRAALAGKEEGQSGERGDVVGYWGPEKS